jgi:predicted metal-binding membrane protein
MIRERVPGTQGPTRGSRTPLSDHSSTLHRETPVFTSDKMALSVTAILISTAAVAWAITYYLTPLTTSEGMEAMGVASMVSSLSPGSIGLFELIWTVGMVAMMFPAIVPVIVFYVRMAAKAESNPSVAKAVGTPLFLLGYLGVYAGLGLLAYFAVYAALHVTPAVPALVSVAFLAPSLVLILAGFYQLTPMKLRALSHCVSPLAFFAVHLRRGLFGSLRMGVSHGAYCVGCCWAFMLVMLAVGAMGLTFMAALAAVIAFEKVIVRGAIWFDRAIAVGFIAAGGLVFLFPALVGM